MGTKVKVIIGIVVAVIIAVFAVSMSNNNLFQGKMFEMPKITVTMPTFKSILAEPIPQAWINQFNQDFVISFLPYGEDRPVDFTADQKEKLRNEIYRAIYVVSRLDSFFSQRLPWTNGKTYYEWLKNTINKIEYDANPTLEQFGGDGIIHLNGTLALSNIDEGYLSTWYNSSSGMGIMSAFIGIITHEARHNNGISHAVCNGEVNMDKNLRGMGAHGVNAIFSHWLRYKLPQEMVDSAISQYGSSFLNPLFSVQRMCTFDKRSGSLDKADSDWIRSISGHDLLMYP